MMNKVIETPNDNDIDSYSSCLCVTCSGSGDNQCPQCQVKFHKTVKNSPKFYARTRKRFVPLPSLKPLSAAAPFLNADDGKKVTPSIPSSNAAIRFFQKISKSRRQQQPPKPEPDIDCTSMRLRNLSLAPVGSSKSSVSTVNNTPASSLSIRANAVTTLKEDHDKNQPSPQQKEGSLTEKKCPQRRERNQPLPVISSVISFCGSNDSEVPSNDIGSFAPGFAVPAPPAPVAPAVVTAAAITVTAGEEEANGSSFVVMPVPVSLAMICGNKRWIPPTITNSCGSGNGGEAAFSSSGNSAFGRHKRRIIVVVGTALPSPVTTDP